MKRTARLVVSVAALLLAVMVGVVEAADWPCWHGPDRNNISPETGINKDWNTRPPQKLWQTAMHDNGHTGPAVAEGKVFIIDHVGTQDVVRAISLTDGSDVWEFRYEDPSKYFQGHSRATPAYANGKLYTLSHLGKVHCLDANTGQMIWRRDLPSELGGKRVTYGWAPSPLVDGDKVIVCPGGVNSAVAALDANTGQTIWQGGGSDPAGYATPVKATILGTEQYVVFTGKSLIGVDAATGQLLWRHPWETPYDVNAATPVVAGNEIFISTGYNTGCAVVRVQPNGPVELWRNKEVMAHFSSPVYYQGFIFANSDPGLLVCLNPATGVAAWKRPGFEKGALVAVDGTIIAMNGRDGQVVMVEATGNGYHELGRVQPFGDQITDQSWTAPIVADGKLIVRNKKLLVCLDLR